MIAYISLVCGLAIIFYGHKIASHNRSPSLELRAISTLLVATFAVLMSVFYGWRVLGIEHGGIDLGAYSRIYKSGKGSFADAVLSQRVEKGYATVQWLFNIFELSFNSFLFFLFCIQLFLYKKITDSIKTKNVVSILSFILISFFLVSGFNTLRATISTYILFIGLIYLSRESYLRAIIITTIAALIQIASLWGYLIIFYWWIYNKTKNKKVFFLLFLMSLLLSLVSVEIFKFLLNKIGYGSYLYRLREDEASYLNYIYAIIIFVLFYPLTKKENYLSPLSKLTIIILPTIIWILPLYESINIAYRFNFIYILIFAFLCSDLIIACWKKGGRYYFYALIPFCYFLLKTYGFFTVDYLSAQNWALDPSLHIF